MILRSLVRKARQPLLTPLQRVFSNQPPPPFSDSTGKPQKHSSLFAKKARPAQEEKKQEP